MKKGEGRRRGMEEILFYGKLIQNMTILQYFKLLEYFPFMIKVNFRDYEKMTVRVTQDQNLTKKNPK